MLPTFDATSDWRLRTNRNSAVQTHFGNVGKYLRSVTYVRFGRALLHLSAWVRRQHSLRVLFPLCPQALRDRVNAAIAAPVFAHARFPDLPPVSSTPEIVPRREAEGFTNASAIGVNVYGFLTGQFGLAESARSYARALMDAGYPVALNNIELDTSHEFGDTSVAAHIGDRAPYGINLVFVNPDYLQQALERIGPRQIEGRYTIACWFWELETVPSNWHWAFGRVDEILVASQFVESALKRSTTKPVTRVPLPIYALEDSGVSRQQFGLPDDVFVFLTSFDFHSSIQRKNPFAVIRAFQQAFSGGDEPVRLIVKSVNGRKHPDAFSSLLRHAGSDARILIRDETLDRRHLAALQRSSDACVSLHRSEGFGIGMAECMSIGKPVIATAWSGNLEFMNAENSCLVDYQLIEVGARDYGLNVGAGARWAEASIDHAAQWMSQLANDRHLARSIGERAAQSIGSSLSPTVAAERLIRRLGEISEQQTKSQMQQ